MYARKQHIIRQSESQQPQAVTLANPFRIPLHRKRKVKKKIRGQRLRVHPFNPWAFFWPESCGRRLTGELWHDIPYSSTSKIKKSFFLFFALTPSLFVWNALFIGVSVVRVGVRANFYPHTFTPSLFRQEAEAIRCRRFEAIVNERYDFFDKEKLKGDFLAYFKRLPDKKNSKWQHVYMHFRTFTQGKCTNRSTWVIQ